MSYMIRLDMIGKQNARDARHAQQVVKDLGISYMYAVPQPMGDSWLFFGVDKSVNLAYDWMSIEEVDPNSWIGFGLSKDMADALCEKQTSKG